jgi:hypothetical protein
LLLARVRSRGHGRPGLSALAAPRSAAGDAIRIVARCAHNCAKASEITALLSTARWRENLVGCVACLTVARDACPIEALWGAALRRSWVSPQLCAAVSIVDPAFTSRGELALQRLLGDWHEFEGTQRPTKAKIGASLTVLLGFDAAGVEDLLVADPDNATRIAAEWRSDIIELLRSLGMQTVG